jgi:murein DD-endopeptidase MepM/ murein hydrolase activator NlpD
MRNWDLSDTRRHAPLVRRRAIHPAAVDATASYAYLGRVKRRGGDIFGDHIGERQRGGFRWLLTTCLAGAVGATAVVVVIIGSSDSGKNPSLSGILQQTADLRGPAFKLSTAPDAGLKWAISKTDKLQTMTGTLSARFIIQDSVRVMRNKRQLIVNKSYSRVLARLAPIPGGEVDKIPAFNPYKLYASPGASQDAAAGGDAETQDIGVRVLELLGGLLPAEDGQELDQNEVADIVGRAMASQDDVATAAAIRGGFQPEGADRLQGPQMLAERSARAAPEKLPPNTSALAKTSIEDDLADDLEAREVRVVKVGRGQTLTRILKDMGGETGPVRAMVEAAKSMVPDNSLISGQEVHVTLVPSLTKTNKSEPVRFSVFGEGQEHKVTVARNAAGEFVSSQSPIDERMARAAMTNEDMPQTASLYASFYYAALSHGLPLDTINQILRIHAYETDFRRRVRGGDQIEWFFDARDDDKAPEGSLGDLLVTAITTGGETQKFYRFRTADGITDFYDEAGNTSRKFLMRRPVRGDSIRLASGFGPRRHPILNFVRPHNGVDWAGPIGTPIMAAGSGIVEDATRKVENGNYIRIRHANGYKTTYSHMSRFAAGISEGVRVRQGQIIGAIGNTGLSVGPHLHFEVLVNSQPVDPMSIQVPRERQLTGNQLRDFQRERGRIDELMRRNPVSSKIMDQVAQR